jgi:MFS family permease
MTTSPCGPGPGSALTQRGGAFPAPSLVRWRIVALLMALCFISHANRAAMSVAGTDRIMSQYGISPTQMGMIYSSFLLVYSLCMIPGGVFIDRFGPRRALLLVGFGSAILGAASGLTGWGFQTAASLLFALTLVRGMMGLVSAPLHPAAARAVGNWFPYAQRSSANGWVTAAAIAGIAACYPGVGALIDAFDWPAALIICAAITAVVTVGWAWMATDRPSTHPQVNEAERRLIEGEMETVTASSSVLALDPAPTRQAEVFEKSGPGRTGWALGRNRSLLLLTFSYAAVGYFQYLFAYWMQFYFQDSLQIPPTRSKLYASALQVALAVGMPLGGWLSARLARARGVRLGRVVVAGGGMTLSALLLCLGLFAREPIWIVVWFALAHVAIGASEGPIWATAVDIGGAHGGTAAAICNTGGNVGGLLAPILTPWVSASFGWPIGIGLGGAICLLGAVCWLRIHPRPEA